MVSGSFLTHAKSYESDCFSLHVRESIEINSTRKPIYSQLTQGRSDKIFNFLIGAERLSLIPAAYYDWKAKKFQKKGVPLFCYEFMSMNSSQDFNPKTMIIPKETFEPFDWKTYEGKLKDSLNKKDAVEIKKISLEAIKALSAYPNYYCMLRHMLESIYRFAYFLPIQEHASRDVGLGSPAKLTFGLIKLHLLSLVSAYQTDLWSAPIQKEGIPILCSELPKLLDDLNLED
jgi:hypothetical protein